MFVCSPSFLFFLESLEQRSAKIEKQKGELEINLKNMHSNLSDLEKDRQTLR